MQHSWHSAVVQRLREHRAAGHDFDIAWSLAMAALPPQGQNAGEATPRLFDERGERADTLVSFFRRSCEAAWHDVRDVEGSGNGPAIRHFAAEMIRVVDASEPARRSTMSRSRYRQAA